MVAEVTGGSVRVAAFRYTETGSPVPTAAPRNDDLIWELHGKTFGGDGRPWDLVLVKIRRDGPGARVTFSSGEAADAWRVNPENMGRLPESLRWLPGELPEPRQALDRRRGRARAGDRRRHLGAPGTERPGLGHVRDGGRGLGRLGDDVRVPVRRVRATGADPSARLLRSVQGLARSKTRGTGGEAWDAVLVKLHRDSASLVMDFASGEAADDVARDPAEPHPGSRGAASAPRGLPSARSGRRHRQTASTPGVGPVRAEVPLLFAPVHTNEDVNLVIGDRTNTT